MSLKIGDIAPDFEADSTEGHFRFRQWNVGYWTVLVTFARDLDRARLTEFGQLSRLKKQWDAAKVQILGVGTPSIRHPANWAKGTERSLALQLNFPLIADQSGDVGRLYEFDAAGATAIVLDPRGVVRFVRRDPVDGVRDFEDLLHVVRVLQFTDAYAGAVWAA